MRRLILLTLLLTALVPTATLAQEAGESNANEDILVRVNGSDSVAENEVVNTAVVVRGNLDISGEVTGAAVVVDGNMSVLNGARVDGRIVVVDGTVTLRDGSIVNGDIHLSGDASWITEQGATFNGEVREDTFGLDIGRDAAWQLVILGLAWWLVSTLLAIAAAVVFAGIGGRQLWSSAGYLTSRTGATLLTTLLFWLGLALVTIPMVLTIIGVLALPIVIGIALTVWMLGYVTFATRLGASFTGEQTTDDSVAHPYLASIAGTIILQIVLLIAVGFGLAGILARTLNDNGGIGILLGAPALVLYVLLWLFGLLGGGAVVLRAVTAWSSRE